MNLDERLREQLRRQESRGLHRSLQRTSIAADGMVLRDGATLLDFSSNDYLNLSRHPEVIAAAQGAIRLHGTGARSSRLVGGEHPLLAELEGALADLKGAESCLLFPSGYQANLTLLSALVQSTDAIFLERGAHACLVEGAALSRARLRVFRADRLEMLREGLLRHQDHAARWIVCDAVQSMDGTVAPVRELLDLAREHDGVLILDDAHGTGVLGEGSGTVGHLGIDARFCASLLIVTATLSKALGSQGGAVLGTELLREYLINYGKGFIYSTGLSPGNVGAALAAVSQIRRSGLPGQLLGRVTHFRQLLADRGIAVSLTDPTPIIPIIVGEPEAAMALSAALREAGYLAVAIRPPTVPKGTSRVRLSVTLGQSAEALLRVADAVHDALRRLGLRTFPPGATP